MLSDEGIKEFQKIYKAQYGVDISYEKAAELGENLLRLYKAVLKPRSEIYGKQTGGHNRGDGSNSQCSR